MTIHSVQLVCFEVTTEICLDMEITVAKLRKSFRLHYADYEGRRTFKENLAYCKTAKTVLFFKEVTLTSSQLQY